MIARPMPAPRSEALGAGQMKQAGDAGHDAVVVSEYTTPALTGIPQSPDPRAWLEPFPAPRRSGIANIFHCTVRDGHSTPDAVVCQVRQKVQRRLQWISTPTETAHLQAVLDALQTDYAGALAYAQSVLDFERLPYEARQRV